MNHAITALPMYQMSFARICEGQLKVVHIRCFSRRKPAIGEVFSFGKCIGVREVLGFGEKIICQN